MRIQIIIDNQLFFEKDTTSYYNKYIMALSEAMIELEKRRLEYCQHLFAQRLAGARESGIELTAEKIEKIRNISFNPEIEEMVMG